eukprot:701572-Rhodomonas_salina.1
MAEALDHGLFEAGALARVVHAAELRDRPPVRLAAQHTLGPRWQAVSFTDLWQHGPGIRRLLQQT